MLPSFLKTSNMLLKSPSNILTKFLIKFKGFKNLLNLSLLKNV